MEGSPLGLTECGSEDDIENLQSPNYGQHPALVKSTVSQDWERTESWDASILAEFMEPLPDDYDLNNALGWSQHPQELNSYINANVQPVLSKHITQRNNMPSLMAAESHTTPATFSPGPANFMFDGVPVQGS